MKNFEILQNGTIFNRFRSSDLIRQNVAISSLIFDRSNEIVRLKLEKTKFSGRFEIGLCQCLTDMDVLEKMEKLVSLKFISDEKGNHNFTSEGKSFISLNNLKIIADLLFSQNENDVIQFWKRGEEILINFGKKLPPPKTEFLRDSDGSVWFELCRSKSPVRIFIDSSFHDTGYITGTGNFPVLPLHEDDLEKKMKNLAPTDKNCPILTLTKEILQKLKIKESEFEKSNNGSIKAICYCCSCIAIRKEKTKINGWVKFYLNLPQKEKLLDGPRYFRLINKGYLKSFLRTRSDAQRDIRDSTGGVFYSSLENFEPGCSFTLDHHHVTYKISLMGRLNFSKVLQENKDSTFKDDKTLDRHLTQILVKTVKK